MTHSPISLLSGLAMMALLVTALLTAIALLTGQSFFVVGPLAWSVLLTIDAVRLTICAGMLRETTTEDSHNTFQAWRSE
jgi:hypothetical protein